MAKKNKSKSEIQDINKIVKKVKSLMIETIVGEWLSTPQKEWNNKSPLQMIKEGNSQEIIESIDLAKKMLLADRKSSINKK